MLYILILGSDNSESSAGLTTSQTLAILTDEGHLSVALVGITPVIVLVRLLISMSQFYASTACLFVTSAHFPTEYSFTFSFLSQIGSHVAQEGSNS